jgi:branched-chain amino acid transport system substrate-binding protein
MKKILLATIALIVPAAAPAMAQQTIKIGFISTFSGPVAAIGADMRNAFELGLDHHGRKLGGLPVEVIYEDDQTKPEVGVQKTQKLIESDKVDFVVGYIWRASCARPTCSRPPGTTTRRPKRSGST